ncbi:3-keto-5-aminohexanoate cleavage protein [Mesorhizobium loti]|uniref:3-keto-5-aminohexanoate cleavage protein n=1 Tax=Rhizobium loti TaxID=381 RepID=UPI00047C4701|nr:3-keto-5-aminohexanoate cleavage protein [Mesorhizobium loti]
MNSDGRIPGPLYVQFVIGVKNAIPVDRDVFDYYIRTVERLAPQAKWCGAGIGVHQITRDECFIVAGGHCLTGLEDNVRLDRD